ncbi:MAG: aminoacyl-tRNA hydrolase [Pseudobdellovibrionaceae bacterium]
MYLIVGLGNPGPKYALTRHNMGFLALDMWARAINAPDWGEEQKAWTLKFKKEEETLLLAKPMTYMNKSGESVIGLMNFYKITADRILVVHDEIDLPFNKMKLQKNRGPGGHNGLKSINQLLGHQDYARLKLGVGRPPHPEMDIADYVLQKFSTDEQNQLPEYLNRAVDAMETFVFEGLQKASTAFNQ